MPRQRVPIEATELPRITDLSITTRQAEDIPDVDVILELGIEAHETDEFMRAFKFVTAQLSGQNVKQAAETAGIARSLVYNEKWQRFISTARRLVMAPAIMEVQSVVTKVYNEWPAIVDTLIDTAKNAKRDSDRNEAADLLYNFYIRDAQAPADVSEARKYLRESQSFNPQLPLTAVQVNEGATVHITYNTTPPESSGPAGGVDIRAEHDDGNFSPMPL